MKSAGETVIPGTRTAVLEGPSHTPFLQPTAKPQLPLVSELPGHRLRLQCPSASSLCLQGVPPHFSDDWAQRLQRELCSDPPNSGRTQPPRLSLSTLFSSELLLLHYCLLTLSLLLPAQNTSSGSVVLNSTSRTLNCTRHPTGQYSLKERQLLRFYVSRMVKPQSPYTSHSSALNFSLSQDHKTSDLNSLQRKEYRSVHGLGSTESSTRPWPLLPAVITRDGSNTLLVVSLRVIHTETW